MSIILLLRKQKQKPNKQIKAVGSLNSSDHTQGGTALGL